MEKGNEPSARGTRENEESPASNREELSGKQKAFIVLIVLLTLLLIGGGFYWLGTQEKKDEVSSESVATESAEPEPSEEATPSPTTALTATPSLTPTTAPSPTPTTAPTPTPTPTPTTETISSAASLDGFRSSNAAGSNWMDVRVGRNVNLVTRGFVSFGTAHIPAAATIEKATLRLYQTKIVGDPYIAGIRVMVDHLDYGSSLEHADYSASSISSSFATLSNNGTYEWKEVDVTDAVRNDRQNGRERSQFRLHLATENIGGTLTGDFAYFESADNSEGTGNTPQLVVTYY